MPRPAFATADMILYSLGFASGAGSLGSDSILARALVEVILKYGLNLWIVENDIGVCYLLRARPIGWRNSGNLLVGISHCSRNA